MPKRAREALLEECDTWGKYAVKGHFETGLPWVRCHSYVADSLARITGGQADRSGGDEHPHREPAPDDGQFLPPD